jgi:hypothetical protein
MKLGDKVVIVVVAGDGSFGVGQVLSLNGGRVI